MITKKEFERWKKGIPGYLHWKRKVIRNKLYDHEKILNEKIKQLSFLQNSQIYVDFMSPYFQFKINEKSGIMLDVGGEGFEIVGDKMIKYCLNPLIENNNEKHFVRGVGEFLPFENNFFDFVVMKNSLEYTINPIMIIREINRVLKNDGEFYLNMCTKDVFDLPRPLEGSLNYHTIHLLLDPYFYCKTEFYDFWQKFTYHGIKKNMIIKKGMMPKFLHNFLDKEIPSMKKTFMNINFQQ